MTLKHIRAIADDYTKTSRWVTVLIFDGVQTNPVNLRIIGIGRKLIRLMHADGHIRNIVADDITNVW
jgi:hypothetical protein